MAGNLKASLNEDGSELTLVFKLTQPKLSTKGKMYSIMSTSGWIKLNTCGLAPEIPIAVNINGGFYKEEVEDAKAALPYLRELTTLPTDDAKSS